jgi:hypothetical protein
MCAVLDGLGRPQGLVMEAFDCGWDKIVYHPNLYPLTWTQRLTVLHSVAEGMRCYHVTKWDFPNVDFPRHENYPRRGDHTSRFEICEYFG